MLDQKDLGILEKMLETMGNKIEESVLEKVDERLCRIEESILKKVDERLFKSESLILDEIERTRNILDNRIDKVEKNIDELNQYYKITKLENNNTALLLKMVEELSGRMDKLEKSTA